jgi:hypothetical protein
MQTPLVGGTEPKRRFVPSKSEHKKVMKMVRAIRKVRHWVAQWLIDLNERSVLMLSGVRPSLRQKKTYSASSSHTQGRMVIGPKKKSDEPEVYDLWADGPGDGKARLPPSMHMPAPKPALPGKLQSGAAWRAPQDF